jgi:hypothetical protein
MKSILLFLFGCVTFPLFGQKYYSKHFDFNNNNQEEIRDFIIKNDTLIIRGTVFDCPDPEKSCTYLGKYSILSNLFLQNLFLDEIQSGLSILTDNNNYFLSSEERVFNQSVTLNKTDNDLNFLEKKELSLQDTRYYEYFITKSIRFGNKLIIGAHVPDSLDKYLDSGVWKEKQKAVLFVTDFDLNMDTAIVFSPPFGTRMRIESYAIGPDSNLYIAFHHRRFIIPTSTDTEHVRMILGFDKDFNQIFSWTGPPNNLDITNSNILIDKDSIIYINYFLNYRSYLYALNPDGSKKWECPFDSVLGQNSYSGFNLSLAKNGDIIGSAKIQSAEFGIGSTGYLFRVSPSGTMKWNKVFRVNQGIDTNPNWTPYGHLAYFNKVAELDNEDIIAGGTIVYFRGNDHPLGAYNSDLWIVRTDSNGCIWKDCPYIQDINGS